MAGWNWLLFLDWGWCSSLFFLSRFVALVCVCLDFVCHIHIFCSLGSHWQSTYSPTCLSECVVVVIVRCRCVVYDFRSVSVCLCARFCKPTTKSRASLSDTHSLLIYQHQSGRMSSNANAFYRTSDKKIASLKHYRSRARTFPPFIFFYAVGM
jgi:hypothetical protein